MDALVADGLGTYEPSRKLGVEAPMFPCVPQSLGLLGKRRTISPRLAPKEMT